MIKSIVTFREILLDCNFPKVYEVLYYKHQVDAMQKSEFETCANAYKNVIAQLLMKPVKKAAMPLHISYLKEDYGDSNEYYYHVNFLNPKYVEPPTGKYNSNLKKYNKYFGILGGNWNDIVNAEVVIDDSACNITIETLVAEILWEITFFGYSEKQQNDFVDCLKEKTKEIKKESSKKKK